MSERDEINKFGRLVASTNKNVGELCASAINSFPLDYGEVGYLIERNSARKRHYENLLAAARRMTYSATIERKMDDGESVTPEDLRAAREAAIITPR